MRRSAALFLLGSMIVFSACYSLSARRGQEVAIDSDKPAPAASITELREETLPKAEAGAKTRIGAEDSFEAQEGKQRQQVPLDSANAAQAGDRKIIRNGEITIETDDPNEGQRKIGAIAEKHGGFVVISESKQNMAVSQTVASTVVNVVVRVPAQNFQATIEEIRALGGRIPHEKTSGQDVTEEYIDLEARIRTKRALEAQFLEIMKQARKISDALEVQTQLADVRTEIEQLEGRRRFLENQSALSTINITLRTPTAVVAAATRGFFYDLKAALGDGVNVGTEIVLGVIRFVIVMIPVTLFILLPAWFVFKWLRKRGAWPAKTAVVSATNPGE